MFPEPRPRKGVVWMGGRVKTPPFSKAARFEAGDLIRQLQEGELLQFPHSRPMPIVGKRCHELRVVDERASWRVIYRLEPDAIVILEVFRKTTPQTPLRTIATCQRRLRSYEATARED